MLAAPEAIPPNPNIAATMASITKMIVQRNILMYLRLIIAAAGRYSWHTPLKMDILCEAY